MTAPSLVLLGYGSPDPRVAQVSHELRDELLDIRPELDVHVGFLEQGAPSGMSVVNRLVGQGVTEIVLVPLLLSEAFGAPAAVPALAAQAAAAHSGLRITAARPIGPETHLLSILDQRLREALRVRRVCELDALVFAAAGSTDVRSNALVARRARQWATHHKLPHVVSFAGGSGPSTAEAIRSLRAQGRRHIAVGSWFLAPGLLWTHQTELAYAGGAVAVSAPMGGEPEIAEVALTRYVVAAMDLVAVDEPLDLEDFEPAPLRHLSVVGA
jgi:sirohydrochlorin ferrochelatase